VETIRRNAKSNVLFFAAGMPLIQEKAALKY